MDANTSAQAVAKVLGEPVFIGLSDEARRVRSRLMGLGIIAVALSLGNLKVTSGAPIFGLQLSGLTDKIVTNALAIGLLYLLIHFMWLCGDSFREWRLRITGTRVAHVTVAKLASEHGDYPDDPRQSTLYSWWLSRTRELRNVTILVSDARSLLVELAPRLGAALPSHDDRLVITHTGQQVNEITRKLDELEGTLRKTVATIEAARIPVSLERFDRWYRGFSRSQNLRWLTVDMLVPIVLAVGGIVLLLAGDS